MIWAERAGHGSHSDAFVLVSMSKTLTLFSFTLLFSASVLLFIWYLHSASRLTFTVYAPDTVFKPHVVRHIVRPECRRYLAVHESDPVTVEPAPGRDKILGSLITHVVRPECRETLMLLENDPEILVSVKTTSRYHKHRLSLLLFTWMETVSPRQLYVITDKGADDVWIKEVEYSGINVVRADCPSGHTMKSLCCKSGIEYEQYYIATGKGTTYRWFCHFDDDEYLNIGTLSTLLRGYNSSRKYYVGHTPAQAGRKPQSLGFFKRFPEAKRRRYFFAAGASYCVSAALMKDVEKYFRGSKKFASTCHKIGLPDDFTVGAIIGGVLGVDLTEVPTMLSQGDDFKKLKTTSLPNLITLSSKEHLNNRIQVPGSPFDKTEDPTRFFSYHCLLYPHTTWCWNKEIHVHH